MHFVVNMDIKDIQSKVNIHILYVYVLRAVQVGLYLYQIY